MTNLTHNCLVLWFVYYSPLHVSSNVVLIIRSSNFINTASDMVTLCKWPCGALHYTTPNQMETGRQESAKVTKFFYPNFFLIRRPHSFLISALDWGEWSTSRPSHFIPVERLHGTHRIGDWLDPSYCLDAVERESLLPMSRIELRSSST